jgi:glycosyltransferase involved in cell wall biosynthesis
MHRSGTSAVTQLLGGLGLTLPKTLMPPTEDNPSGYFESLPIARFNKRMLESAGVHWRDWAGVPAAWFSDLGRHADVAEATALIQDQYGDAESIVIKDPCLCRLMPLWRNVFEALSLRWSAVLVVRRPSEVARSLAVRVGAQATSGAAVTDAAKCSLLWLRYLLDAEAHTRDVPRHVVDHSALIGRPVDALAKVCRMLDSAGMERGPADLSTVCESVRPELHRQHGSWSTVASGAASGAASHRSAERWIDGLYRQVCMVGESDERSMLGEVLADVRTRLDRTDDVYATMRSRADRDGPADRVAGAALRAVAGCFALGAPSRGRAHPRERVLYVSGSVGSVGHELRVLNGVEAWREGGHDASWCPADSEDLLLRAADASLVIVFRAKWSPVLEALYGACAGRGVPVRYDIDDLIFDPEVIRRRHVAILDSLPDAQIDRWELDAELYRRALAASNTATVTTEPLAAWAAAVCGSAQVLPNTLGPKVEAIADQAWSERAGRLGGAAPQCVRLGYASGTPSHHRDFGVISEVLARILRMHPGAVLTVVGELDAGRIDALRDLGSQVEVRRRVPWPELPREVARFDVNLAPLEPHNPFCECKSEIRCTMASMVGVPTIASPTQPQRASVIDGVTGWIASSADDWERCLHESLCGADLRNRLGYAARQDVKLRFGWTEARSTIARA